MFFQPEWVAWPSLRILLLVLAGLVVGLSVFYVNMDPFVLLQYALGILLTYQMAQKTLSWVANNRTRIRNEVARAEENERRVNEQMLQKDIRIQQFQADIQKISHIYDKVKLLSHSLELLDAFVVLSEALIENFSLKKSRLVLLGVREGDPQKNIDRVYQMDPKHLEFTPQDKTLVSQEVIYRGEVYPFDLRLVEYFSKSERAFYFSAGEEPQPEEGLKLPASADGFFAAPIHSAGELEAFLTLEGLKKEDSLAAQILIDRFLAEFRRIKLYADVQRLAITDWLTGAYVRRYFFKRLEEEVGRSTRFNLKFSFLMIDLDDFKVCNDRYGHLVGDAILKEVVRLIKEVLREVDLVGRYGGEEFAAILLDTDENGAMYVAERIRKRIETHSFRVYDLDLRMTTSIGLATYSSRIQEAGEIVEWADSALYQAKRKGKNRVCAYIGTSA